MKRSIGVLGAVALSLTMFACSNGVGRGARVAPGPEAFGLTDDAATVKTAGGALPAPGHEYAAKTEVVTAKGGAQVAPGVESVAVESASR